MSAGLRDRALEALRPVARRLTAGRGRILMYHRFGASDSFRRMPQDVFAEQLRYLKDHFNVRPLGELTARLAAGRPFEPDSVAITVDDGYRDFYTHAYPVIREYRVPVTVYVVSRFIDQRIWLWFDAIHHLVHAAAPGEYTLPREQRVRQLASEASRNEAWNALADIGLGLAPEPRGRLIDELATCLNVALPPVPTADYAAMTWDEVRSLDPQLVEIGVHTLTHPILSRCEAAEQRREIDEARAEIERQINRPAAAFCYPNGQPGDFDGATLEILRHGSYSSAVVAHGGMVGAGADLRLLERLGAPESMRDFRMCVDGVWELRRRLERFALPRRRRAAPAAGHF